MDVLAIIQREWPVISQAPWSVGALAVACLVTGWVVGRFLGSERTRNLLSRLERRDDEIADLKRKIAEQPNSPDRKALRLALAAFASEGATLQQKCRIEQGEIPVDSINDWANRVAAWLREKLDDSYVQRFMNSAGLAPLVPNGQLTEEQKNTWMWVHHRMERINQFLSELN